MPPARFVADDSLEFLARRLRLLGYDVMGLHGARLEDLFEAGRRDGRTVLTMSTRRPARFADVPALTVPREDPAAAIRSLAAGHESAGPPFSRCPACNRALHRRSTFEAMGEVPGGVTRSAKELHYCPECGKWYWDGSHTARLRAWFEGVLGHPIDPTA